LFTLYHPLYPNAILSQIVQPLDTNIESVIDSIRNYNRPLGGNEPNVEAAVDLLVDEFFTESRGDRLEAPNIAMMFASGGISVSSFQASASRARTSGE
jgi:hypothetical protein